MKGPFLDILDRVWCLRKCLQRIEGYLGDSSIVMRIPGIRL